MASVNITVYLFGGSTTAGLSNELWKLESVNTTWALLTGGENVNLQMQPSARQFHAMASVFDMLFLFGGKTNTQRYCNELWSFDTTSEGWAVLKGDAHDTQPSARKGHTMTGVGSSLVVFGGETGRLWDNMFNVHYAELSSELWNFCTLQHKWALLNEAAGVHGVPPSARINQAMTAVETDVFVHGGQVVALDPNGNFRGMETSDELFKFNSVTRVWVQLTGNSGNLQVLRFGHTLTAVHSQLVLHGGDTGTGLSDETYSWTAFVDFPSTFAKLSINVYDGDTMIVRSGTDANWKWEADLCTRYFLPCSNLTITGDIHGTGTIRRHASSKIVCVAEQGCTGLTLQHVTVTCDPLDVAKEGPLQVSGEDAVLRLQNTTMSGCAAFADGGSIRAFRSAQLMVSDAVFRRSFSHGNGGALALVGASAKIVSSSFENCTVSSGSGGAAWASGAAQPYPLLTMLPSFLNWTNCTFHNNSADSGLGGAMSIVMQSQCELEGSSFKDNSADSGGAIAISSESTVTVSKCDFSYNAATKWGGAMAMTAQSVVTMVLSHLTLNSAAKGGALASESAKATIIGCDLILNSATDSGGAVAVVAQSGAIIQGSNFVANTAEGLGGGAMHVSASFLELLANILTG
eukprot:CAMPEP_0173058104 /NCGR_PEP_ID=MMETSP1102-20130122/1155_1 /TAXON_ID=49646 /ORGANISM="Geminigera sp., Strain Caron Lab Isolate" /LENGTH=631 /DNA_ID=CAMNT_0013923783 /DNA_START=73 /DNA_END=1964 /DNA_ORIENTATION=+